MKLNLKNKTIIIADDSDVANKIVRGFDFEVNDNNQITVFDTKLKIQNKYQLANAIREAHSVPELKGVLLKMMEFIDGVI